jgi:peptide deformylase
MIIPDNDLRLKQVCKPFNFDTGYTMEDGSILSAEKLFYLLKEQMIANKGVGLSACQIGIMTRAFVIGNFTDPDSVISVFNPRIVNMGTDEIVYEEGCISYPGLFLKIKRASEFEVRFSGWDGTAGTTMFKGYTARVFLHELDHLDGITFQRRANRFHLEQGLTQKRKYDRIIKSRLTA